MPLSPNATQIDKCLFMTNNRVFSLSIHQMVPNMDIMITSSVFVDTHQRFHINARAGTMKEQLHTVPGNKGTALTRLMDTD